MSEFQSLQVHMLEYQEPNSPENITLMDPAPHLGLKRWQWLLLVVLNVTFLLVGQAAATLLGNFYYEQGGKSTWTVALLQTVAFPILFLPRFLVSYVSPDLSADISSSLVTSCTAQISLGKLVLIYVFLGLLQAGDNMMYSVGLLYLPLSTYSLLCATQLAFNAIFSFLINAEKFTALILNAVIILSLSAVLLTVNSDSSESIGVSTGEYALGSICTLGASAAYALVLCLMQFSFQKIIKQETFSVVLDMQIYTSVFATFACVIGLFASGEWSGLKGEMEGFTTGRVSYVMTLVWTGVAWQIYSVGIAGLIFLVSALFCNVINTVSLPFVPILSVIIFHDKMDVVKVVAMLMAVWGFASYLYQNYLDDVKTRARNVSQDSGSCTFCERRKEGQSLVCSPSVEPDVH